MHRLTFFFFIVALSSGGNAQFHPGPYGIDPFQVAAPFTVPTLDGDWDFYAEWNGQETYVFIQYARGHSYGEPLWNSSKSNLLLNSPMNVHYFFLSFDQNATNASNEVTAMKAGFDATLQGGSFTQQQRDHWNTHLHYVPTPARSVQGWVGDVLRKTGYFVFAIDRFQRMRTVGLLSFVANPAPPPEMRFIANEPKYFNYEWETEQRLTQENPTVVPVFLKADNAGNRFSGPVSFPDAETMKHFDKMEIELNLGCVNRSVSNCFEWDYLANLYICDDADTSVCNREIGRWVTAYHREGYWITDATPMLPFLMSGGTKRFRFNTLDKWIVDMNIRLHRTGSGLQAYDIVPLWTGGQFNLQYNPSKAPKTIVMTPDIKKVQVVALISGHGFGADMENCAEFCNHTHHFMVNGREFVKSHPEAGSQFGCMDQVPNGVTPNQYGTWYFGRGGWCPGFDVRPFVADITSALQPGDNTLSYRALFRGQEYNPVPAPGGGTFWGRIDLTSYLVLWRDTPATDIWSLSSPAKVELQQNYPNPFKGSTALRFSIDKSSIVQIQVYDIAGRNVATAVDGFFEAGSHDVRFEPHGLRGGVYYYRLTAGDRTLTRSFTLVD